MPVIASYWGLTRKRATLHAASVSTSVPSRSTCSVSQAKAVARTRAS